MKLSTNSFDKRIKAEDFNRSLNVEPSADHRIQEHVINRTCDLQWTGYVPAPSKGDRPKGNQTLELFNIIT